MAKAFWTLEDGRTITGRWTGMAFMLGLITNELKEINGAKEFYDYLDKFVYSAESGDQYNGYGGFIRKGEDIMFNLDLRTFAPKNRDYFWQATQKALSIIKTRKEFENGGLESLLTTLMDMHKRIMKNEDPMLLNDLGEVEPATSEKLGPGW